jgi:hypothetical protein
MAAEANPERRATSKILRDPSLPCGRRRHRGHEAQLFQCIVLCDFLFDLRIALCDNIGDVKALKGAAGMRLRSGDWRVLFTIKANTITIHAVGHRRDIYD